MAKKDSTPKRKAQSEQTKTPKSIHPGIFINPLTDFGFKRLFKDKELLIDFLGQALPDVKIKDVTYEDKELIGDEAERRAVLDLLCMTDNDEYVMIEMQRAQQKHFADRALFYGAHLIRKQGQVGQQWRYELNAVYVVSVLNFSLKEGSDSFIDHVALMNIETKELFSKKLNFTFIQLRNFTKSEQELSSNFDDWLYCLKNLYHLTSRPKAVRGKVFAKMFKLMKIKQLNKEDMELYEKSVKEYDDILDAISFEGSKREAIGEARGIAIGETRGIAIGEARGIAIGETRGEERAKRTIVKSLLSKGFTLKDIEQLTGIPLDDLISICHK
jgi:predicted transposase/invertase (TIGR01784 family)